MDEEGNGKDIMEEGEKWEWEQNGCRREETMRRSQNDETGENE